MQRREKQFDAVEFMGGRCVASLGESRVNRTGMLLGRREYSLSALVIRSIAHNRMAACRGGVDLGRFSICRRP